MNTTAVTGSNMAAGGVPAAPAGVGQPSEAVQQLMALGFSRPEVCCICYD